MSLMSERGRLSAANKWTPPRLNAWPPHLAAPRRVVGVSPALWASFVIMSITPAFEAQSPDLSGKRGLSANSSCIVMLSSVILVRRCPRPQQ